MSMTLRADVFVPVPVDRAYAVWIDAARYPGWQGGVLAVREVTGSLSDVGTTYVLDHGPKLKRRVRVVGAERPSRHVIEQDGVGVQDQTVATFEAEGDGTRVNIAIFMHFNAVMRILARLDRRSRLEREVQAELDRFRVLATRVTGPARVGGVYVVEAASIRRRVTVIGRDVDHIHVAVHPGHLRKGDADAVVPTAPKPLDHLMDLRTIDPGIRAGAAITASGLPFLLRDGGHGIAHLALTEDAWADAAPREVAVTEVADTDRAAVAYWERTGRPVVGRDADLDLAPMCSLRLGVDGAGADVWAVATVIRREIMRVHLAIAGERWPERPESPATWRHGARPIVPAAGNADDGPPWLYVGHFPVDRSTFKAADPVGIGVTPLESRSLEGYRMWREQRGGTMSTLQPMVDLSWRSDGAPVDDPLKAP